jgi:hypothetical protein
MTRLHRHANLPVDVPGDEFSKGFLKTALDLFAQQTMSSNFCCASLNVTIEETPAVFFSK